MFSIVKIWALLRKNPEVLVVALVIACVAGVGLYANSQRNKKIEYRDQVTVLKADTLKKRFEILTLKHDTAFYVRELRKVNAKVDSLQATDSKLNPGLVKELPDIDKIKKK